LGASFGSAKPLVRLQRATFDPLQKSEVLPEPEATQRLWILSFSHPITESLKSEIRNQGLEILDFVPDQALLVRGERRELTLREPAMWTAYQPAWKWSQDLPTPSSFSDQPAQVVVVRAFQAKDMKALLGKIQSLPRALVLHQSGTYLVVRSYGPELYRLSAMDEVAHLQALPEFQTLQIDLGRIESASARAEITGYETGTRVMNFEEAWKQGFKGAGQIVAMGDTGLDMGDVQNIHADFTGAVLRGRNFAPFGKSWEDPMGHGTHVAGSVVSRGTKSQGQFKGGAHEAGFIAHSLWSPMLNNLMVPTKLSDMFADGFTAGARVHTNSWGSARSFGTYDGFARQVDEYSFNNPDMLVIFAAGNSGVDMNKDGRIDADSIGSPATAKNVLSVGASENYELQGGIQRKVSELRNAKDIWGAEPIYSSKISDIPQGLAMFSSRGPTDDGRIKPDVVAPGTNILSTRTRHPNGNPLWGLYGDDYAWSGGTSMSTPLVAAAAAVTRQILQTQHKIQNPSSSLLKAVLMNTATDLFPGQYGAGGATQGQELLTARPNSDQGFGLVNMKTILEKDSFLALEDQRQGLSTGESQSFNVTVPQGARLAVTLVWNDAPAAESAGRALVNNLDLEVSGPETQYASNDAVNNFEHFEKIAKPGSYTIKVIGRQVPNGRQGRQPFSLVVRTLAPAQN